MSDPIKNFPSQFAYEPEIVNPAEHRQYERYIVVGMGGSALAGDLLTAWKPELPVVVRRDYGLPAETLAKAGLPPADKQRTLVIVSSYSGNTEEAIEAFHEAQKLGLPNISITIGGKLLELAKAAKIPYIQMPDLHLQPREALGLSFRAHLRALNLDEALRETRGLATSLIPANYETAGRELAERLHDSVPVIYSSTRNRIIGYVWKIKFNETAKIPAFANVFPELNHNEMTGFDIQPATAAIAGNFRFIFLADDDDHPQIRKRMDITAGLLRERKLSVEMVHLEGPSRFAKMFSLILLADWTTYHAAKAYGSDPTEVPMQENLKKAL